MPSKPPTSGAEAPRPARRRAAATEPVPAAEPVAEAPKPTRDRTLVWAVAVLAGLAFFGAGYGIGHAVADDDHRGDGPWAMYEEGRFEGHHHGDITGMMPGGMIPGGMMPGQTMVVIVPGYPMAPVYPEVMPVPVFPDSGGEMVIEGGGYLGVEIRETPGAVVVVAVEPGSPAEKAGIEAGDRVISFGGRQIESMDQFVDLVRGTEPGTEVEVVLGGPGGARSVTVVVGARPNG